MERPYRLVYGVMDIKQVLMLQHKLSNPRPAEHGEHPAIRRHYCTRPANLTGSSKIYALL